MACSEWKVPCLPVEPWHRTLVFLFTRTLMMFSYSLNCGHCTLGRVGHVAGDDVAAHDAAEDVDQHRLDVAVGQDDLERLGHHFRRGAAADIEEVGGLAAVQLDQ